MSDGVDLVTSTSRVALQRGSGLVEKAARGRLIPPIRFGGMVRIAEASRGRVTAFRGSRGALVVTGVVT